MSKQHPREWTISSWGLYSKVIGPNVGACVVVEREAYERLREHSERFAQELENLVELNELSEDTTLHAALAEYRKEFPK